MSQASRKRWLLFFFFPKKKNCDFFNQENWDFIFSSVHYANYANYAIFLKFFGEKLTDFQYYN
jgi:hypothetical protein